MFTLKKIQEHIFFKLIFVWPLLIVVLYSCTKPIDALNPQDSYKYYPIEIGEVRLYEKVTLSYAVGEKQKIDSVMVKEIVKSKTANTNETIFIIERQTKGKNDLFFKPELVFQVIKNPKQIIAAERNIYKVLLYFPIYLGAEWNINEVNGQDEKIAEIVPTDEIPSKLFTDKNIIKVEIDDFKSIIDWNKSYSLYSKDIGLIYSEDTHLEYCQDDGCIGKDIIESGKRVFIRLLDYTKAK
jgi:hypothetical protein